MNTEKKTGAKEKKQPERLLILQTVIKKSGLSIPQIAEKSGHFPQQIRYWFIVDDMHLAQLNKIASSVSMKLEPYFTVDDNLLSDIFTGKISNEHTTIHIDSFEEKLKENNDDLIIEKYPPELYERYKGGNIRFVAEFIVQTKMSFTGFARKCGFNPTLMKNWMVEDDLKLSRLHVMAEKFKAKLNWKISYVPHQ